MSEMHPSARFVAISGRGKTRTRALAIALKAPGRAGSMEQAEAAAQTLWRDRFPKVA